MKHIKVVLVGDANSHKWQLLVAYTTCSPPGEIVPVNTTFSENIMVDDQAINLYMWDTSGQEDYKKLRPLSYPHTNVFILCFSLVSPTQLENIENMWVPEIKEHCPGIPYILVGTQSNLRDDFKMHKDEFEKNGWEAVPKEKGLEMMKKIGARAYIECDCMKLFHIKEVFEEAARTALQHKKELEEEEEKKKKEEEKKKKKDKKKIKKEDKEKKKTKKPIFSFFKKKKSNEDKNIQSIDYSYSSDNDDTDNQNKSTVSEPILEVSHSKSEENKNDDKRSKSENFSPSTFENPTKEEPEVCLFIDDNDEKYHVFVEQISQNDFFVMTKIIDIRNDRVMCKKTLTSEVETFTHMKNIMKEFDLFQSIDHPCICHLYGINTSETIQKDYTTISLFLEYLDYNLNDCITKKMLSNTIKTRIIIEILHGMLFIHNSGLIHRDLKIDNIRLNSFLKSKIVDLGLVKINELLIPDYSISQTSFAKKFGSAVFMSPELLKDEDYDNKTDVYSFGILLYNIFVEKLPKYTMKDKLDQKNFPLPSPSSSISEFCIDLISSCISLDPKSRPSFDEILDRIRSNNYLLADDIDQEFVSQRDHELINYDS